MLSSQKGLLAAYWFLGALGEGSDCDLRVCPSPPVWKSRNPGIKTKNKMISNIIKIRSAENTDKVLISSNNHLPTTAGTNFNNFSMDRQQSLKYVLRLFSSVLLGGPKGSTCCYPPLAGMYVCKWRLDADACISCTLWEWHFLWEWRFLLRLLQSHHWVNVLLWQQGFPLAQGK